MRGYFIQYKKKFQEKMQKIMDKNRNIETELQKTPMDSKILHQITLLHQQLSRLTVQEIEIKLNYVNKIILSLQINQGDGWNIN